MPANSQIISKTLRRFDHEGASGWRWRSGAAAAAQKNPRPTVRKAQGGGIYMLTQGFAQLLCTRQPERLDAWLQQATTSSLAALQRLAQSFQRDYAAVKVGVTVP